MYFLSVVTYGFSCIFSFKQAKELQANFVHLSLLSKLVIIIIFFSVICKIC